MEYNNPFMLGKIKTVKGCASRPHSGDNRSIIIINSVSGEYEGTEIVKGNAAIAKIYPKAKEKYRAWWRNQQGFKLGEFQATQVQSDTEIINLLIADDAEVINEGAVKGGLNKLGTHLSQNRLNAHINKLDNEDEWALVEAGLKEYLAKRGVNVTVYE